MLKNSNHIDPKRVVSQEEIERYLKGELTFEQEHALEKLALEDPFLQDALEGMESINVDFSGVEDFNDRLLKHKTGLPSPNSSSWMAWAAVASVAVITFGLFFFIKEGKKQKVAFEELVVKEQVEDVVETKPEVIKVEKAIGGDKEVVVDEENAVISKEEVMVEKPTMAVSEDAIMPVEEPVEEREELVFDDEEIERGDELADLDIKEVDGVVEIMEEEELEEYAPVTEINYLEAGFAYLPPRRDFYSAQHEGVVVMNKGVELNESQEIKGYRSKEKSKKKSKSDKKAPQKFKSSGGKKDSYYYNQVPQQEETITDSLVVIDDNDFVFEATKSEVDLMDQGFRFIQQRNWTEALNTYKVIASQNQLDNEARFYRSVANIYLENYSLAIADLEMLLIDYNQTKKDGIQWYLAYAYLQSGDLRSAEPLLQQLSLSTISDYRHLAQQILQLKYQY